MINKAERSFSIQQMFVILVLAVFLVFSMLMVVLGALCYCGLEDKSQQVNNTRILQSYVRSALSAQEENAVVLVEDYTAPTGEQVPLLVIENNYDGDIYRQYIYAYEGQLKQQFISVERGFLPENGDGVCPANLFVPNVQDGLLTVEMQGADGSAFTLYETVLAPAGEGGSL